MSEGTPQEWYLEINGSRTGPFTTEQVLGLLTEGEILETQKILGTAPGSQWTTARELALRELKPSDDGSHASNPARAFVPPPRPAELQPSHEPTHSRVIAPPSPSESPAPSTPEMTLFDTLLAAKERKAQSARATPPELTPTTPNPFQFNAIPRNAWILVGTAALLCAGAWGVVHFIKQKAPAGAEIVETRPGMPVTPPAVGGGTPPAPNPISAPAPAPLRGAPPGNPAALSPTQIQASEREREKEREREREREREHERERDLAAANAAAQAVAPPPMPPLGGDNGVPVPPPPPPLPESQTPMSEPPGAVNPSANTENPPPPAPPPLE